MVGREQPSRNPWLDHIIISVVVESIRTRAANVTSHHSPVNSKSLGNEQHELRYAIIAFEAYVFIDTSYSFVDY